MSPLDGMRSAAASYDRSADVVARAGLDPDGTAGDALSAQQQDAVPDLVDGIVGTITSASAYGANARVLSAQSEMQGTLIDILA